MGRKIGETVLVRGSPSSGDRTLEVSVEDDWLVGAQLEKCVTFSELRNQLGRTIAVFSRSISATEARSFAALLVEAAEALEAEKIDPNEG